MDDSELQRLVSERLADLGEWTIVTTNGTFNATYKGEVAPEDAGALLAKAVGQVHEWAHAGASMISVEDTDGDIRVRTL